MKPTTFNCPIHFSIYSLYPMKYCHKMLGYPINPHLSPIEPPSTPVNLIKPSSLNSHETPRKPPITTPPVKPH